MKMFNSQDIPHEVYSVHAIMYYGGPVGKSVYDQCLHVVNKYPEHFPWEHLYHSIPKEVHKAYELEAYGPKKSFEEQFEEFKIGADHRPSGGIKELIEKAPKYTYQYDPNFNIGEAFEKMYAQKQEEDRKKFEEQQRLRTIWNKHYSKYKLTFSTQKHFL